MYKYSNSEDLSEGLLGICRLGCRHRILLLMPISSWLSDSKIKN